MRVYPALSLSAPGREQKDRSAVADLKKQPFAPLTRQRHGINMRMGVRPGVTKLVRGGAELGRLSTAHLRAEYGAVLAAGTADERC